MYRGYMNGVFAVEDEQILVRRHKLMFRNRTDEPWLKAQARTLLPDLDQLNKTSPIDQSDFDFPLQRDDLCAIHLVRWFKHDFMRWVDPIKCPNCGHDTTHQNSFGPEGMTEEERRVAGRVEVWKCTQDGCGAVDRFLRFK